MARPAATPEQREEVRRKIREAAAHIYRQNGIAAISARAVAERAGVSIGTIYLHFGDLTGLLQSLWTGHVEKQNAKFRDIASRVPDPVERLRALLIAYVEFGLKNTALYRNAFLYVRPESHEKPQQVSLTAFEFPALLIAALREGQASGLIVAGDPEHQAQILWSGVHGCLALPLNIDRIAFADPKKLTTPMVEMMVGGVTRV
jgi:AcrR family transcriptional regulator